MKPKRNFSVKNTIIQINLKNDYRESMLDLSTQKKKPVTLKIEHLKLLSLRNKKNKRGNKTGQRNLWPSSSGLTFIL